MHRPTSLILTDFRRARNKPSTSRTQASMRAVGRSLGRYINAALAYTVHRSVGANAYVYLLSQVCAASCCYCCCCCCCAYVSSLASSATTQAAASSATRITATWVEDVWFQWVILYETVTWLQFACTFDLWEDLILGDKWDRKHLFFDTICLLIIIL